MCLLVAAHRVHPAYALAVAANRDELHARPTAPLHRWAGSGIHAGRDLAAGGTWLGVDPTGRFAAVTNFHEPLAAPDPSRPSRGALVTDFLAGKASAAAYLAALAARAGDYAGFNLLVGDAGSLWYASNRAPEFARELPPGIYGVSNHLLDTPWPKTVRARLGIAKWVDSGARTLEPLHSLLLDATPGNDSSLPWPAGSGPFVRGTRFGTRSASWLARDVAQWQLAEENFTADAESSGVTRFNVSLTP